MMLLSISTWVLIPLHLLVRRKEKKKEKKQWRNGTHVWSCRKGRGRKLWRTPCATSDGLSLQWFAGPPCFNRCRIKRQLQLVFKAFSPRVCFMKIVQLVRETSFVSLSCKLFRVVVQKRRQKPFASLPWSPRHGFGRLSPWTCSFDSIRYLVSFGLKLLNS